MTDQLRQLDASSCPRGGRNAVLLAVCLSLPLLWLPACSRSEQSPSTPDAAQVQQSSGPLMVTLTTDRSTISTAERLTLTIKTTLQPGASLTAPTIEGTLGGWTVIDRRDSGARRKSDGSVHSQLQLTLEPFLAGGYEVPPISFTYKPDATGAETGTLTTQPLPITVTSVLDEEPKELTVSPPRGPIALPARSAGSWWVVGALGLALFATAGGVLAYRRLRHRTEPPAEWQIARLALSRAAADTAIPLPWPGALEQASRALSGYLRHELDLGPGAVTAIDLEGSESFRLRLGHRSYERALTLLQRMEALRFGGADIDQTARRDLVASVLSLTGDPDISEGHAP